MPVEVERDQGELSVKVDIENATENKEEIVVPTSKEDVVNGISHGGNNGNVNDKEDTDGSYVFITKNDTVGDDSVKPVNVTVEKDLREGESLNSGELKMEAISTADDVFGVSRDSQTLEKSEKESTVDGLEEVIGIPKSEIEDPLEKSFEQQHPGNGHLEIGQNGKLESTQEVEQGQGSEVGPRDLPKNMEDPLHLQEKREREIESDSKTYVDGDQGDRIETQEKTDLDVSEDLQHSEDVAKHPVDSDERRESELVSAKVSPSDPNDGDMSLGQPTLTDQAYTVNGSESVNDRIISESMANLNSVSVENGHPLFESEFEKVGAIPSSEAKVNASDGDVLPDKGTGDVAVSEVSSDVPAEIQTLTAVTSGKDGVVENDSSKSESEAIQDLDLIVNDKVQSGIGGFDVSVDGGRMNTHQELLDQPSGDPNTTGALISKIDESQDVREPACDQVSVADGSMNTHQELIEEPSGDPNTMGALISKTDESQDASKPACDQVSVADGSTNSHQELLDEPSGDPNTTGALISKIDESQDASEPACDQDGKQHIAAEVTQILDAPSSEESDAVIVAKISVSEAPISDGLSCTNQQESEHGEISGLVEKLPLQALHEDAPSGNDISGNLNDDTRSQGFTEDHGDQNEKLASVEKVQENNSGGNLTIGNDVCLNSAEETKESPTEDLSGNESHESAETLSTNINRPLSSLDSKTAVSELAESSEERAAGERGAVSTKSEDVQSVKESSASTEPHVIAPTIEDGEIKREVNCGSNLNVTKTTPVDACEDTPPEEVSEMEEPGIKERFAANTDEVVDSDTKSFDGITPPLVNNDVVKVGEVEDSREEKNETSTSVASETNACEHDLKSKVVTSTDTTMHTGAIDSVDSQTAETKGGDVADITDDKVVSTCEIAETQLLKHLALASSKEGSALDASEGHTVAAETERRPFYFLPRVPRYDDEKLAEQLKNAEAQVDQKTQSRDALRADIQKIRAACKDYDISYKAAMAEERSARKAMHSKRQEIEALQSVISRVKSAASLDDIDLRMHNMEHMIQHETLSLSEEKGLIREIKQLKQLRDQISSSMGSKDEVKQALDEKEKTEERLKMLRKELDVLRNDLSKVEAITKAAKKKCDEEWEVQSKLQEQFRAADAVRQEAFVHLQDLKKQQREKNKYFFKYRDDSRAASEMALKKDRAALESLCSDQVENFMNMWNNDEAFRNYYVRCNTRSTFRRLGTLDGRSLGPDEEPPQITYATRTDKLRTSSERAAKHETAPPVSAQKEKVVKYEGSKVENSGKAVANLAEQKSQNTKSKKTAKPDELPQTVMDLVEEIEKPATTVEEEAPKMSKEEEELIKKEEEKRKQKEAAKMKEQNRLEEIAKAKEAMERKKKREEKAKARAVLKAQKEAEEREKEREKKLRKKERRKGIATSEEATESPIEISETVIETPREIEIPKKQTAEESQQIKKTHKPFLKQNKSKSIPLPLRNRGSKRKLRQWMWIGLVVLVALALFLLGNANLSFSPANLWFI